MNLQAVRCVSPIMRLATRPHVRRSLFALVTAALLVAGSAACGSDDSTATSSGDGATTTGDSGGGGPEGDGTIVAEDFSLADLTVAPGAEIVLQNDGSTKHTATADDGSFDLEADGGQSSDPATAPAEAGSYPFHCEIHASMTATLTVEG